MARSTVEGAIDGARSVRLKAEDAASAAATGAIEAAREVSESAAAAVTKAVSETISGIKVVLKTPIKKK